jgi:hypothetical protein
LWKPHDYGCFTVGFTPFIILHDPRFVDRHIEKVTDQRGPGGRKGIRITIPAFLPVSEEHDAGRPIVDDLTDIEFENNSGKKGEQQRLSCFTIVVT